MACSLIAGLVGTIWLDAGPAPQPTADPLLPEQDAVGEYEAAMRTAIAVNPDDAAAIVSLANLLTLEGNLPEAIDLFERALAVEPENAPARRAFALALGQSGSLADAEVQLQRLVEADPNDAESLFFLGQLYERWSPPRPADAALLYRRAVAADPGSVSADEAAKAMARLPAGASASPGATP